MFFHSLFHYYFGKAEFKKSLKTDSRRQAVKLARAYRVELDKEMAKLEKGNYAAFEVTLEGKIPHPTKQSEFITGKITRTLSIQDEDTCEYKKQLTEQLREEAHHQVKLDNIIIQPQLVSQKDSTFRAVMLSEVKDAFIDNKVYEGNWDADPKDSTHKQGCARLALLCDIVGEKLSTELTELDAIKVEETLPRIPANANKGRLAKLHSLQEKIDTNDATHPRLGKRTQNKIWELFKALIKFGHQKKYIQSDITQNCRGIRFSKKDGKKNQWRKFTDVDLQYMFTGYVYQLKKRPRTRSHDYHFWLPLLAAYTGGRVNELAQLLLIDVKQFEGVWYIHITDEDQEGRKVEGKKVKSDAGRRKVPIHSKLLDLGFIDCIQQPRDGKYKDMIFTSGLSYSTRKKWGGNASRWFNGYCKLSRL